MIARVLFVTLLATAGACGGSAGTQPAHPGTGHVVVTDTTIEILDPVSFTADDEVTASSHPILDASAATLVGNPEITLLEVQAHLADGDAAQRQARADHRANAVMAYLVAKQVAPARLRAKGIATASAAGTSDVELFVLSRAPAE